jgi:hypothetical protein
VILMKTLFVIAALAGFTVGAVYAFINLSNYPVRLSASHAPDVIVAPNAMIAYPITFGFIQIKSDTFCNYVTAKMYYTADGPTKTFSTDTSISFAPVQ